MAVDNCSIHIVDMDSKILDRFPWEEKKTKDGKIYHEYYLPFTNDLKRNTPKLHLVLRQKKGECYKLIINNSLRKWYFKKNNKRDLYKSDLECCINHLSERLGIPLYKIMDSKLTKLEIGFTIPLKPKYRKLQNLACFYPRLPKKISKETTYFGSRNSSYHLLWYDKLSEICNKTKKNQKRIKNLNTKIYFMRYEISINKVSQVPFYNKRANTFRKLLNNWDEVMENIIAKTKKIIFVDWSSKFVPNTPKTNELLKKKMLYESIQNIGLYTYFKKIDKLDSTNKTYYRKDIIKLFEEHSEGKNKNLDVNFLFKLSKKIELISNN